MSQTKLLIIYMMIIYIYTIDLKKFLMTLISMELLMFTTGMIMFSSLSKLNAEYLIIYFLVIMVAESVMGLSLLIMMSRIYNNDSMLITEMSW